MIFWGKGQDPRQTCTTVKREAFSPPKTKRLKNDMRSSKQQTKNKQRSSSCVGGEMASLHGREWEGERDGGAAICFCDDEVQTLHEWHCREAITGHRIDQI